jgi:2-polyprenyl-6-methoxyphenol hydroxylase-like FAD-dependent oxidoreductase
MARSASMSPADTPTRIPVLIAGAGPVGLTLALELGWRGVPCTLVEPNEEFSGNPKAKTVHQRTLELFRRWGRDVPDKLRAAAPLGADFPSTILYVTRLTGELITALHNATPADSGNRLSPERTLRIPQSFLEPVLREEVRHVPAVDFRLGWKLERVEQHRGEVHAEIVHAASGERKQVIAQYLAGCDGGRSTVRKQLGIGLHRLSDVKQALGGVFHAPTLWSTLAFEKAFHYNVLNDDLPHLAVVGPLQPPDLWFFDLMGVDADALDAAEIIRNVIGRQIPFDIRDAAPWTVHNALAERYREGRVFLLGDAAHLQSPSGGYGMNGGVGDAVNFGWKLAAVIQGWSGENLLDSYEIERRQFHARALAETIQNSEDNELVTPGLEDPVRGETLRAQLGDRIRRTKPKNFQSLGISLGYRYETSPVIVPDGTPPTPYETSRYIPTAHPGHRAPHAWLPDGTAIFDHFGRGFTLLTLGPQDIDCSSMEQAACARGVPLTVLRRSEPELRELYEADLVLIRPDQHVGWRSDAEPEDPGAVIDVLRGAAPQTMS